MAEKTQAELLKEKLLYKPTSTGDGMTDADFDAAERFAEGYRAFLDAAKTEREAVDYTIKLLDKAGYHPFEQGRAYAAGDKLYCNVRGRALIMVTMGTKPLSEGVHIVASHIDSPRIDLKQRPLYEEGQLAFFKTHYYGGIKKYQWTAIPLALHGVVIKKDGSTLKVSIGEKDTDPVFTITDLLPHLSKDQMDRKLRDGIRGEELNILVGSRPFKDDKASERVKLRIAQILYEKYDLVEADFLSAELMLVPAFKARDVGLDASMLGAYGQDDRVCAYTSLMAEIEAKNPTYTTVTVFADKEEVGSDGNTGLHSEFMRYFLADLAAPHGVPVHRLLQNSRCLSADVSNAVDPTFPEVAEKNNSAYLGYGVAVMKYSGVGGKGGTNDASAEFMGYVRRLFDEAGVLWQTCELGKVDQGGGGTVAKFVANIGVEVIDVGVPVLSMHSPFEITSKADIYQAYRAFRAFYQ